jgi:hypothetical protein
MFFSPCILILLMSFLSLIPIASSQNIPHGL